MKQADWKECMEQNLSVKVTPDGERAKSLIGTAIGRIESAREPGEKTANFVFEDYYSSALELAHAIAILDGYKISNHVCLGHYLRDVLERRDMYVVFDDLRYKRNALTYYGKMMDFGTAKESIEKCRKLIRELKALFRERSVERKSG